MKKILTILIFLLLIVIVIVVYQYNSYKVQALRNQKLNEEYEMFTKGEILGTSLITLINKAIDSNQKNNIQLDENKLYMSNEHNSIRIEVKFSESDEIYSMESIGKLGPEQFIKNYATMTFKCVEKLYHEKANTIKYMLFEQI